MDRALKERIVGAVVLVAIVVLVVPVFLDGPPPESRTISEPVTLPGQSREPGARRTVVLDRDRDQPMPEAPAPDAGRRAQPAADPVASARNARPEAEPASAGAGASGEEETGAATAAKEETAAAASEASSAGAGPQVAVAAGTPAEPARSTPSGDGGRDAAPAAAPAASATGMWAVQLGSFSNKANADRLAAGLREKGYAAFLSRHATASGEVHRVRVGPQEDRASAEAVAARLAGEGIKGQVVPHP